MLSDFTPFELILYAIAWCAIGGLIGFYLLMSLDRNPRNGAQAGVLVGVLVGFGIALTEVTTTLEGIFNVILVLVGIAIVIGVGANVTGTGKSDYHTRSNIRQATADLAYGLLLPTFVIVFTIIVFPMIWNVVLAFRPVRLANLRDLSIFSVQGLTLDNFDRVFRNSDRFLEEFWPTLLDTVILLALLVVGWFAGLFAGRRLNMATPANGALLGLGAAIVVCFFLASSMAYSASIDILISGRWFLNTLMRTLIYTLGGTVLAILMGLIAALVVKDSFRGRNIVRGFMLFPYIAPIVSVVFVWTLLLNAQFGLVNEVIDQTGGQRIDFLGTSGWAFLMIILFQGWRYFPFAFLFILARIQAIPDDIYEAAKVDGAAPSQRLMYVTLPQLRAVFGTLFLLRFIWTFNKFDDVFLLTGGAAQTQLVTIEIYDQLFARSDVGTASAVALVLALVLFIVVGIYFRWFFVEEN